MKRWRVSLAVFLLIVSYVSIAASCAYLKDQGLQALIFFFSLTVGIYSLSLTQDDGRERNRK